MLLYVQHRGISSEFWCSEEKMGQESSVPGDVDETPEVLSTTSGRALCLSGFVGAISKYLFNFRPNVANFWLQLNLWYLREINAFQN